MNISLPVVITKHGSRYIAYTPALDLSTSASSLAKVQKRFEEIVNIFFEEVISAGTAYDVLTELGWEHRAQMWNPPQVITPSPLTVKIPTFA